MFKRSVVRLLLVAIPCCLSYVALRPTPRTVGPTFVVCSYEGRHIVIAPKYAQCGTGKEAETGKTRVLRILPSSQKPAPAVEHRRIVASADTFNQSFATPELQ